MIFYFDETFSRSIDFDSVDDTHEKPSKWSRSERFLNFGFL